MKRSVGVITGLAALAILVGAVSAGAGDSYAGQVWVSPHFPAENTVDHRHKASHRHGHGSHGHKHRDHLILDYYSGHHKHHRKHHHHPHSHKKKKGVHDTVTVDGKGKKKGTAKTISDALAMVKPYGTVIVKPKSPGSDGGIYRESLTINHPVRIEAAVDEFARPNDRVAISPGVGEPCATIDTHGVVGLHDLDWIIPAEDNPGSAPCLAAYNGRLEVENNYITGRRGGAAVYVSGREVSLIGNEIAHAGAGVVIEVAPEGRRRRTVNDGAYEVRGNTIYDIERGIVLSGTSRSDYQIHRPTLTISENTIAHASKVGLVVQDVEALAVFGNTFADNGLDGIQLIRSGGEYINNEVLRSGRDGMVFDATRYKPSLENNLVLYSQRYGLRFVNEPAATFANNRIMRNRHCMTKKHTRWDVSIRYHKSCHNNGRRWIKAGYRDGFARID